MALQTKRFINSRKSCSCSMTGVWKAVSYMEGVVVIFHSPKACAHVARRMDLSSYYMAQAEKHEEKLPLAPLLSSQLEDKHSIFGGGDRLEECMSYAVKTYKPKCLVVASSCVAGVIGDDVLSLCEMAEDRFGIPVITVDSYGFLNGEYYQGYYGTAKELLKRFVKPLPKDENTVLLVGDAGGPWGDYAKEVTRLLAKFGLKVIGQFPGYQPVDQLRLIARAEYIVPLGRPGRVDQGLSQLAEYMAKEYGFKYAANKYPLGLTTTKKWLQAWGELLGQEELAQGICKDEEAQLRLAIAPLVSKTRGVKTVFPIGRYLTYFNPREVFEVMELLEMDLQGVIILNAYEKKDKEEMLEAVKSCSQVPIYEQGDPEAEKLLAGTELVLTTHELKLPGKKQVFIPMIPKVGTIGSIDFMKMLYRVVCSRIKNGGITYVRS